MLLRLLAARSKASLRYAAAPASLWTCSYLSQMARTRAATKATATPHKSHPKPAVVAAAAEAVIAAKPAARAKKSRALKPPQAVPAALPQADAVHAVSKPAKRRRIHTEARNAFLFAYDVWMVTHGLSRQNSVTRKSISRMRFCQCPAAHFTGTGDRW